MSKRGYISRYLWILKKLKASPYSSFEEIEQYVSIRFEYLQMQDDTLSFAFSKRTLQRDVREIKNIFGIDIAYSKQAKGYFIAGGEAEHVGFQRVIESFDMFSSLGLAKDLSPYIHPETRRPLGTEHLHDLVQAIKSQHMVMFAYLKFWEDAATQRTVAPYALKEFKSRWYVLAKDNKDCRIKSFALDRMTELQVSGNTFTMPEGYSAAENYKNCFGIICPDLGEPQKIILSFNPAQGKYIRTLPLHETQCIIADNENELRISLHLFITHDFIMELLSYGSNVTVINPASLVVEVRTMHEQAFQQYEQ